MEAKIQDERKLKNLKEEQTDQKLKNCEDKKIKDKIRDAQDNKEGNILNDSFQSEEDLLSESSDANDEREQKGKKENESIDDMIRESEIVDEKQKAHQGETDENIKKSEEEESFKRPLLRRKSSLFKIMDMTEPLFRPEYQLENSLVDKSEMLWQLMSQYFPRDKNSIQKSIVNHIEYTLARTRFDLDKLVLYQGTALSVRDRLLEAWNDTQSHIKVNDPKRLYYLSIEFLLGRLLQNALINLDLEENYKKALMDIGYNLEDLYEKENDPALGNGGLGRLAACYLDSLTSLNIPAWGYGIRYDYGIFRQVIENCQQKEVPDYWLTKGNPWEIMRTDVKYKVRFYGNLKDEYINGKKVRVWEGGEEVEAVAFDTVVPGWGTFNCNTLRLWKSFPSEEFDFESFNKGEYSSALEDKDNASFITSVLYPNDSTRAGKELRLKQQYFFCAATIQDLIRRFLRSGQPWSEFPKKNAIQLNDTHPTVAITELLHQLVDVYHLEYNEAFAIVNKTFAYTNHTVLPEALEKWPVDLFGHLLPRHMELIYLVNFFFLEDVKKIYPNDGNKISRLSMIEESNPKLIRMANLCIIASHKVNGVAEIHSGLLKTNLFKDFYELYPNKFQNITNGVTPRRWIHCAFPELSELLTEYYGSTDWLGELSLLDNLLSSLKENNQMGEFLNKFAVAKLKAKQRFSEKIKEISGIDVNAKDFLFDVMVKRIHEYKRQFMNALYCIYRYLKLKSMKPEEREKCVKRVTFFGGKAAPGYLVAKNTIRLINMISNVVNNDKDVNQYFKIIFVPDYRVSLAQHIIPAADISQHISTAGTEASGTSNMKFAMTGSLILGTKDGANIEIAKEVGEENVFFFGNDVNNVEKLREDMRNKKWDFIGKPLKKVFKCILNNTFGDTSFMKDYVNNILSGNDYYLICHDFYQYVEAQEKVDSGFRDKESWNTKCIETICRMGFFSSDRSINEYAEKIWNVEPLEVPKPSSEKGKHYVSQQNLKNLGKPNKLKK